MRKAPLRLLLLVAAAYAVTSYGGIRSSDAEVVFRVSLSLAERGGFALERDLEDWRGFGVAPGRDGRLYAIYPPLQSLLAVPLVWAGGAAAAAGFDRILAPVVPPSHFAAAGWADALAGRRPADPAPHVRRFFASWFNVIVGVLGAWVFWRIVLLMTASAATASGMTLLYALGTLLWPYAGTFFTEPLATLLALAAFLILMERDPAFGAPPPCGGGRAFIGAGICLGLACAAHLTAGLFIPFFLYYAGSLGRHGRGADRLRLAAAFLLGLAAVLGLLGAYNAVRFGSPFEDGRALSVMNANLYHAPWTGPWWTGLWGQILSAHKGLLLFCPAVVLGALGWRRLARRHGTLAWLIAGMAAARLLFIAAFNSWDAGFCVGPRYLVMLVPFLLLPAAALLSDLKGRTALRLLGAAALLCILQQYYFCTGEIFSYYHSVRAAQAGAEAPLTDRTLYLDWGTSPLLHLLEGQKGPWPFRALPFGAVPLWAGGSALIALLFPPLFRRWERALGMEANP